jgi:hypothetical protein
MLKLSAVTAMLGCGMALTGHAQLLDPQFYIGSGLGTPCASGCAGDPNQIGGSTFNIGLPSHGPTNNPVLVFFAIPNASAVTPAPLISSVTDGTTNYTFLLGGSAPAGFLVTGARGWNTATGQVGAAGFAPYTSSSVCGSPGNCDVYDFIGLTPPVDRSIDQGNLFGASSSYATLNGFNPSDFAIFEYQINVSLTSTTPIGINMASPMSSGTVVFGYGQDPTHAYSTPWTVAGDVHGGNNSPIPEPASFLLLGTVSLITAAILKKKAQRRS